MIVPIGGRGVLFPGRQWRTLAPDHPAAGSRAHDDEVRALTPSPHEQSCARGGRHRARRAWAGPGRLSGEARPPAAALPCRRRGGLCCPARECADGGRARPTVCDREQGGRGRDHRDRRDRQGDTRRLYPSAHDTQSHHQCRAQSEAPLRYRKGPCAGLDLGRSPGTACEPSGGAVRTRLPALSNTPERIPASSTTRPPATERFRMSPWNCCCGGAGSMSPTSRIAERRRP